MVHSGANHMVATLIMRTIFIINDAFNELAKLLKIAENLLRNENLLTEVILGDKLYSDARLDRNGIFYLLDDSSRFLQALNPEDHKNMWKIGDL